ncbi:hypothetical protein [Brevundimonas sp.]|uniref:hypothetical protein n=1 Tax=Brevundimonas sp. TaxID=1871086 RepID=UPI002FD97505
MIPILLLLCLAGLAWTDTAVGRALREALVQRPARKLAAITRGKAVFWTALILAGVLAVVLFEMEGLRLFGMMAPEALTWFMMFDVGVFIDALIIAAAVISGRGWRATTQEARRWLDQGAQALGRIRTAVRASRPRRPHKPARRPDDSEPRPALFLALTLTTQSFAT